MPDSFPRGFGYPPVVVYGGRPGSDWLIVRRLPGQVLSRSWPTMSTEARRRAVSQLAGRLRVLHSTSTPPGLMPLDAPQLLEAGGVAPVLPLMRALDRLRGVPRVENRFVDSVETLAQVARHDDPSVRPTPDSSTATSPSRTSFGTVSRSPWCSTSSGPVAHPRTSSPPPPLADVRLPVPARRGGLRGADPFRGLPRRARRRLADAIPQLFSTPRLFERLTLYAIVYDVRELLAHPPAVEPRSLSPYHPLHRLQNTLRGGATWRGWSGPASNGPRG